jgi:D-alanyl-D-alanine dipeptidase
LKRLCLLLLACGRTHEPSPVPVEPPRDVAVSIDTMSIDAAVPAPIDAAPRARGVIPDAARELIVTTIDDWKATRATLRRYRRDGSEGDWALVGEPWDGVVGFAGAAWGDGLHGKGAPRGRSGPIKREGDGASPAGVFALTGLYGYAKAAPRGTKLSYTPALDDTWQCVDDPKSTLYNKIVDANSVDKDWDSAELMRRGDAQYVWAIEIAHNPKRRPAAGSCHFVHVWTGEGQPTTGCTAMAEPVLRELIATMDPSTVFVLLPRAEYEALAGSWGLPQGTAPSR